jgi:cytochrome P450
MRRPFLEASAVESLAYLGEYGQKEAKRLLDIASKKPSFDALYEYSAPFLTSVIAEWCGIPDDERLLFRKQVHFTCSHFSPLIPGQVTPVYSAGEKLLEIIRRQFLLRQQKPGRDFISMVAQSQYEDVTVDELVDNILLAVFASYETTLHLIGTGTYQLIQTPDVLEALRLNPEIIGEIVDEILRMFGSVQLVTRLVSEDFEYSGKKFEKEQQIWLLLAAANRDGRVFDEPDQLYLGRENKKHLSFGSGAHYCIGTYMAKRLASIAITELFERFPNLSLAGTCDFHPSVGIRGLLNLPVSDRSQLDF